MNSFFKAPLIETLPWLDASGPACDMVISTRARLARNLSAFEFPHQASLATRKTISEELLNKLEASTVLDSRWSLKLSDLNVEEHSLLREKHLTGPATSDSEDHQYLLISGSGSALAKINAEDHLRLHVCKSGFQPGEALTELLVLESDLEKELDFAYRDDFGYLAASPVNAGTGLRLSVMVHLPGLVMGDEIEKILNALRQLRFGVRGLYGNGVAVRGAVFLISSLVTLGRDESEIASDFEFHLGKVLLHERTARQQLFANDSLGLEDLAYRSLAALQQARLMTAQEAADRLNNLRVGVGFDMLSGIDYATLNRAIIQYQTAHLEAEAGQVLSNIERTEARATLLRDIFSSF